MEDINRAFEIRVISAIEIKNVNIFTGMDIYVTVSVNGNPHTLQKTPVFKYSTSTQSNCYVFHKIKNMKFSINESSLRKDSASLVFRLLSRRILGDRLIGTVTVSIARLFNENYRQSQFRYDVQLPTGGKTKGMLDFKFVTPTKTTTAYPLRASSYPAPKPKPQPQPRTHPPPPPPPGSASSYPGPQPQPRPRRPASPEFKDILRLPDYNVLQTSLMSLAFG